MKRFLSVFLAVAMVAGLLCTGALAEDDHKRKPDAPGAAASDKGSDKAAVRVRVNGSWYGSYLEDYRGQTSVWVPVNLDISKLNANTVNYFSFSSNVINQGSYTDSSVDLFATKATQDLNSFACAHQYCDSQFTQYTDRNINVRLELFNGSEWVTAAPQEDTYYDFHEVLGLSGDDTQWHNAARNLAVGSLDGYTAARMMVQLHVGSKLSVPEGFSENSFAVFLPAKYSVTVTAEEGGTVEGAPTADVAFGERVTVRAKPAEGYSFYGWYNSGLLVSREAAYTFAVTRTSALTARFRKGTTASKNPFRILVIGNSHSDDAMAYVWDILTELGYDDVRIGVLYIGGCDIATHVRCAANDSPAYEYRSNVDGTWRNLTNVTMREGIASEEWDYIVLQHSAPKAGVAAEYAKLPELIDHVQRLAPAATLLWHTGFAWRDAVNATGIEPPYESSEDMYTRMIAAVKSEIVPNQNFSGILYTATAVQNAATSALKRVLYRDGVHLSIPLGRYLASLYVAQALTGKSVADIAYTPEGVSQDEKAIVLEAVKRAIEHPQELTPFSGDEVFHRHNPETPGAAVSDKDSDKAAIRVRVNGSWFGAYIQDYKGQNGVWVPVYLDLSKLKANEENSFHLSSNVLSYGNYTDSSLDLFSSWTKEELSSLFTMDPACDGGWSTYSDRNVNMRLELFNGSEWITAAPQEATYFDEHTVLGQFANNGNWYNAGRELKLGDLSGYTAARLMVQLHVGSRLDVLEGYTEADFATFLSASEPEQPEPEQPNPGKPDSDEPKQDAPKTGDSALSFAAIALTVSAMALAIFLLLRRRIRG